jgi:hypothetical protein
MYSIDHAKRILRQCRHDEQTLRRYSIAVLQELCAENGIDVEMRGSRHLKKPYIDALLIHVRQRTSPVLTTELAKARGPTRYRPSRIEAETSALLATEGEYFFGGLNSRLHSR